VTTDTQAERQIAKKHLCSAMAERPHEFGDCKGVSQLEAKF